MAFITVTSNTKGISFDLGVYASTLGFSKAFRTKASVSIVYLKSDHISYVTSEGVYNIRHELDPTQTNLLVVESVDGEAPTSLEDLYDKLLEILN